MTQAILSALAGFASAIVCAFFLGIWVLPRSKTIGRRGERNAVAATACAIALAAAAVGLGCDGPIGVLASLLGASPLLASAAADLRRLSRPDAAG
jgi:hypothetical protein